MAPSSEVFPAPKESPKQLPGLSLAQVEGHLPPRQAWPTPCGHRLCLGCDGPNETGTPLARRTDGLVWLTGPKGLRHVAPPMRSRPRHSSALLPRARPSLLLRCGCSVGERGEGVPQTHTGTV